MSVELIFFDLKTSSPGQNLGLLSIEKRHSLGRKDPVQDDAQSYVKKIRVDLLKVASPISWTVGDVKHFSCGYSNDLQVPRNYAARLI